MESDHRRGSLDELLRTSWPIVVGLLSYTAMGVADTWFVSRIGSVELAAVGLAATAYFAVNSFALGLLTTVKVLASQAWGGGRRARAHASGWLGLWLVLPLGLLSCLQGLWAEELFALLGASPRVQKLAVIYFRARLWGAPCWLVLLAVSHYLQATGRMRLPMLLTLAANVLNIGLTGWLVFGGGPVPALGVQGAALGSSVAWLLISLPALLVFLRAVGWKWRGAHRSASPWLGVRPRLLLRALRIGLPLGVQRVLQVTGFLAFTGMLAQMGDAALAAHQVALRIVSLSFLPGHGIGEAACVLVGKYVGAGDLAAAQRAFRNAVWLAVAVMGAAGVLFFSAPDLLLGLFLQEGEVLVLGRKLLAVAAFFQVFDAIALSASGALNGGGDTRFTMLVGVGCSWLVCVPGAYLCGVVLGMGAVGAWIGLTADVTAQAGVFLLRYRSQRWFARPRPAR